MAEIYHILGYYWDYKLRYLCHINELYYHIIILEINYLI